MCGPFAIAAATAASGAMQAYGQYQEGVAQSKQYKYMADQSRQEGDLAVSRGQTQSELIQNTASQDNKNLKNNQADFNSSQRVALAIQGQGGTTAEDIVSNTVNNQILDEQALRYNADTKSYEITEGAKYQKYANDAQAGQYDMAAKYAKRAGTISAFTTLLGTATQTGMNYKAMKK